MPPACSPIPLPKGWSPVVRSGLLQAVALAHFAVTVVRGWCANSPIARVRLASENERLKAEVQLLREELRIKDARMARIPPARRPHYPPAERLAILTLQAARAWSSEQLARAFLITAATVASWRARLDDEGPGALVQTPSPVNRFPDFVAALVQQLKARCPLMGNKRIASVLARSGLHLASTTVHRILRRSPQPTPVQTPSTPESAPQRTVIARYPHHVWSPDLTTVPTSAGFFTPWLPHALAQSWPFCGWILVIVDHFSRCAVGFAVFNQQPTEEQVVDAIDLARQRVGHAPKYFVSDHGRQFGEVFRHWCTQHGVKPRYGAVGRYGSISVVERFILTLKSEFLRRMLVPLRLDAMRSELSSFFLWYNTERPHTHLGGATPCEVLRKRTPRNRRPRLEPRARYPADGACAAPQVNARAVGCELQLAVSDLEESRQLPIVRLKRAA